jgi:predicted nucleic acid-binding protein
MAKGIAKGLVVDAAALVDLLLGGSLSNAVATRIAGHALHGPGHLDAEVPSTLDRLNRAGVLEEAMVEHLLEQVRDAPIERHPVDTLLSGAWARRADLRLADALYVELASSLGLRLVTTDARLGTLRLADVVLSPAW